MSMYLNWEKKSQQIIGVSERVRLFTANDVLNNWPEMTS